MARAAFVTGGSGFIGGALVRRLVADGWRVRALARSDASATVVAANGAEAVRGDLDDVGAMADGARGCDATFHCAAHLGDWGTPADFERGNVQGTKNAIEASRRAGVRRFVHVGTEAALLDGEPLVMVDERAPLKPDSPALYSASKARAEAAVVAASSAELETVVVRPGEQWRRRVGVQPLPRSLGRCRILRRQLVRIEGRVRNEDLDVAGAWIERHDRAGVRAERVGRRLLQA